MATCQDCTHEMLDSISCTVADLVIDGRPYPRRRCASWSRTDRTACGDCGAPHGGFHHLGCDLEDCPRCGQQLISCGCMDADDDDEDDIPHLRSVS